MSWDRMGMAGEANLLRPFAMPQDGMRMEETFTVSLSDDVSSAASLGSCRRK